MNICLFEPEELYSPLSACDERAIHIKKILRKKTGDTFLAGVVEGPAGLATIKKIASTDEANEGAIYFSFLPYEDEIAAQGKPLFPLHLIVGIPRPIQLKRLLRDVAALGVSEIHLSATELGEKSYLNASLCLPQKLYKMLREGTVQAGGTHVPKSFVWKNLEECLDSIFKNEIQFSEKTENEKLAQEKNGILKIALDNERPQKSLAQFLKENSPEEKKVFCAVGSERGWSESERALLAKRGFALLGMGNRIMRTETAATVASSIILFQMGKLE